MQCNKSVPIALKTIFQQCRNHWVVKRRHPLPLYKKGGQPRQLYGRHYIYDPVSNSVNLPQPKINLILTRFVEGIGSAGELVAIKERAAYNKFLLPGLAVYATPENLEKYNCKEFAAKNINIYNSIHLQNTLKELKNKPLMIFMSSTKPWTLESKHVAMYYRMAGMYVHESIIEMPPEPISGPLKDAKTFDFEVKIQATINTEIIGKCRVYSWNKESLDDLTAITKENYLN